jgi:hypothetical protein
MNKEEHILFADKPERFFFRASAADFKKIPGSPIAYWVSKNVIQVFETHQQIYKVSISEGQNITADNSKYLRLCWEVDHVKVELAGKWSFYSKGGSYRKWFGNLDYVVDWSDEARRHYHKHPSARIIPKYLRFREGITWTLITSSHQSFRFLPDYSTFDKGGSSIFFNHTVDLKKTLLFLNTKISAYLTNLYNSTLNLQIDDVRKLPLSPELIQFNEDLFCGLINRAHNDWDSYETSWDFTSLPLLKFDYRQTTLKATYQKLLTHWQEMTLEMQRLEEKNNRIFINAYGLQDELTPEVPLNEITLTCNPHYRYSNNKNTEELEALLLADTMKEFLSYAAGCMFGRYALDKPGLILANQSDTIEEYLRQIPDPIFPADEDNVIPILDGDWFPDDITERFRKFLRITFGEEHYEENLKFIEVALGKDIRKYFLKDFYNDHLRRYKKRPIYWLFSSPKGSFNALMYMHRYRPDTVSVVLNGYLREFRTKLLSRKSQLEAVSISASASPGEKTKALKEIESLRKMIEELESYEREILYPLATEQIEIDLDDGVKVNYQKFGPALRKIPGLDAKEE